MNGQMYQICCIAAAARKALQENAPIHYIPMSYENRVEFCFLPEKQLFKQKAYIATNVSQWFEHCKKKGLKEVKFLCPVAVKDRNLLGFSNLTESSLLCFFEKQSCNYFTSDWQFDSLNKEWNVLYTEHEWLNIPSGKPHFENNTDSLKKVLKEIRDFAIRIDCDGFAKIFDHALCILGGSGDTPDRKYGMELPSIPSEYIPVFEAASIADVFGAMGSWNDSPPYMAYEKGLEAEYEALSNELLKNLRLAILYAINEW